MFIIKCLLSNIIDRTAHLRQSGNLPKSYFLKAVNTAKKALNTAYFSNFQLAVSGCISQLCEMSLY